MNEVKEYQTHPYIAIFGTVSVAIGLLTLVYFILTPGPDVTWFSYSMGPLITAGFFAFLTLIKINYIGITYKFTKDKFQIYRYSKLKNEIDLNSLSALSGIDWDMFVVYYDMNKSHMRFNLKELRFKHQKAEFYSQFKEIVTRNTADKEPSGKPSQPYGRP